MKAKSEMIKNLLKKRLHQSICVVPMFFFSATLVTTVGQIPSSMVIPNEYSDKVATGLGTSMVGVGSWQFTYSNSQFAMVVDQEMTINSVALRPKLNSPDSSLDIVVPEIRISMGTWTKPMTELSPISSRNHGNDFTLVYSHENIAMHFVQAGDPRNFSIVFNLDTPFHYQPSQGHFMFEWQASEFNKSSEARVDYAGYPVLGGPVYGATENGNELFYGGFIMEINYTAVPEPSSLMLIIVLGGLGLIFRSLSQKD